MLQPLAEKIKIKILWTTGKIILPRSEDSVYAFRLHVEGRAAEHNQMYWARAEGERPADKEHHCGE